jgi:tetratricopeptide (TPR) repeat protein
MGLDTGVIDVIIDSGGRYVPHTAVLVRMTSGQPRHMDLWYGSRDMRHRRLGLRVKEGRRWVVRDIDYPDLKTLDVSYLPDTYVDGITLYVLGNRYLSRGELTPAVEYYSRAIRLYPENIRPFYNRAIAFEKLGEVQLAEADYRAAFRDENALIRTMAREHPEITTLMRLDERKIDEKAQEMYLLRKGIITGRAVPLPRIAAEFGMTEERVRAILSGIDRKLKKSTT